MDIETGNARPLKGLAWLGVVALVAAPMLIGLVAYAETRHVHMIAFGYDPPDIEVLPGTTVTWHNHDDDASNPEGVHNVTIQGVGDRGDAAYNATRSYTFPSTLRTYSYFCKYHNEPPYYMSGTVKVTNNPSGPQPSVTATVTLSPTGGSRPKPTKKATSSPTPTPTATATATASPTPTPTQTPTPEPTQTLPSSTPLPTFAGGETGDTSGSNLAAITAIVLVVALGAGGYLIYRRFIAAP